MFFQQARTSWHVGVDTFRKTVDEKPEENHLEMFYHASTELMLQADDRYVILRA